MVIRYQGMEELFSLRIIQALKEHGYLKETRGFSKNSRMSGTETHVGVTVGRALCGWALGRAFEGSSLSILTALI
jgi:hypothetical protein